jgi:hypothetical protein
MKVDKMTEEKKTTNKPATKTLSNTSVKQAKEQVSDLEVVGDDLFKLIAKASSKSEGWMKSTKAMNVTGGIVLQVTTQQGDNVAEALTYVPGVSVKQVSRADKTLGYKVV